MKRALGYLIFGVLAIGAVYLSVTRLSPFIEAEESSTGGTDVATEAVLEPPTVLPPTPIPPTIAPPTSVPSPTLLPPTATLLPTEIPATDVSAPTEMLPPPTQVVELLAVTEILPTAVFTATLIPEVIAPTDLEATIAPTAVILDTQSTPMVTPETPGIAPTTMTRGESTGGAQINSGGQLSVGTPIVAPPVVPSATIAILEPTTVPPLDIQPTVAPTIMPTQAVVAVVPLLAQITGSISTPQAVNLILSLPDGTTLSATTTGEGAFAFADLQPGSYRLQANADGFLSSQIEFTLADGQALALPATLLRPGDTNRDNIVDVRDAVLIAANFGGPAVLPETDLNRDGNIDIRDLTLLGAVFGQSGPTPWG